MLQEGHILLHRSILNWEWYGDINTKILFIHLLLTVNYEDAKWRGQTIKRGQRITSIEKLAQETNLSKKQVRTALNHLKATNEVANETSPQNSLITVLNYDKYQSRANKTANEGQTKGKARANEGQQRNKANKAKESNKDICSFFEGFWEQYPRKVSKQNAEKVFEKLNPTKELYEKMVSALSEQKNSEQWTRDDGKFIPYPATWLNQKRWEDEINGTIEQRSEFEIYGTVL